MVLGKSTTLHLGVAMHLAAVITQSDLGFTERRFWGFFQIVSQFILCFSVSILSVTGRTAWLSPASVTV